MTFSSKPIAGTTVFAPLATQAVGTSSTGSAVRVSVTLSGAQIRVDGATPPTALKDETFTVEAKLDAPLSVHLANVSAKGAIDASPVMRAIVAHVANANNRPKLIALATMFLSDADNAGAGSFGVTPPLGSPVRLFLRSDADANVYFPAKVVDKKVVTDTTSPIAIS